MPRQVTSRDGVSDVQEDEWGEPSLSGDRLNPRDIVGHLLILWPIDYVAHSPTKFTRPDKPSDAVILDVCDLDLADESGYQGKLCRGVWWRQARLISMLKARIGIRMLCLMTQGTASTGFNAPFELVSVLSDPTCRERAEAWIKANPDFAPSSPNRGPLPGSIGSGVPAETTPVTVYTGPATKPVQEMTTLERLAAQSQQGVRLPPPPARTLDIPF